MATRLTATQIKALDPKYAPWNDPNSIVADYYATHPTTQASVAPTNPTATVPSSANPVPTGRLTADQIKSIDPKYAPWNDPASIVADYYATHPNGQTPGTSSPSTSAPVDSILSPASPINLQSFYDKAYQDAGIKDLQDEYAKKQKALSDAIGSENENPWLSEATRVGNIEKLQQKFDRDTANITSQIATRKADVETRLGIQTKQIDINNQATTQALQRFNTLLDMGALNGANPNDIASITRSTGLSSGMITSAIARAKQKGIEPQIVTETDNAGNVTYVMIDKATGNIIKKQSLGKIGKGTVKTQVDQKHGYSTMASQDAANGVTLKQMFQIYQGFLQPNEIYSIYNANSKYGPATETPEEIMKYGVTLK